MSLVSSLRPLLALVLLTACGHEEALTCGPGTHEDDGRCMPDASEPPPDTDAPTTGDDTGETPVDDTAEPPVDDTGDSAEPEPEPALVYLLAGQSNMVGIGQLTALPPALREAQDDVQIYWSGREGWNPLQASSDYSTTWAAYMGPEVAFGRAMKDAFPDREVYLVKHADGGTALADWWNPGGDADDLANQGNGYRVFSQAVTDGLARLEAAGVDFEVAGMIWMQGESDAYSAPYADAYEANLKHFIQRMREDVSVPDLPFIIGEIHCLGVCPYRDTVVEAERAVAAEDSQVRSFNTLDLERFPDDDWHYAGIGMRVLGQRFAESLLGETELSAFPTAAVSITGTYTWSYYGAFTVGWSFTALEDLLVTDLGVFDLYDDGLYHSTIAGVWNADTQELLLEADVYGAGLYDTTWHDGFRYVGVEPTVLPAGDYVIGNVSYSWTPDYYVYGAGIAESADVDWLGSRHEDGTVLSFPTALSATSEDAAAWFGPNLLYEVAGAVE